MVWRDDVGNFHAGLRAQELSGSSTLVWSPDRGHLLAAGDRLIVLASRQGLEPFLAPR